MKLEDYFEFLSPDDIRLKGHRIGIDDVLDFLLVRLRGLGVYSLRMEF